jgi:putative endonuclease
VTGYHVYILTCADGSLYTGITTDVERRLHEHNCTSRGAKYTRSRRPVTLAVSWPATDRSAALREEARIKRLTRKQKLELIDNLIEETRVEKGV